MSLKKLLIKAAVDGVTAEVLVDNALAECNGNVSLAARKLGVSRQAIYLRLANRARREREAACK